VSKLDYRFLERFGMVKALEDILVLGENIEND